MIKIVSEPYKNFCNLNPNIYNIVVDIEGLQDPMNILFNGKENSVKVDYDIADIIIRLNEMGFITTFSCSGLKTSHNEKRLAPYLYFSEKISIGNSKKLFGLMEKSEFIVDNKYEGIRCQPCKKHWFYVDDEKDNTLLLNKWNNLRKNLDLC